MKRILLPLIAHRFLRLLLRVGINVPGAWRLRRIVMDVKRLRVSRDLINSKLLLGPKLWLDPNDGMGRRIFYDGLWEPAVAKHFHRNLRPGDHVLDVGANIGQYTVLARSRVGPGGRVISVEADRESARVLRMNAEPGDLVQMDVAEVAAWDSNKTLYLSPGDAESRGVAFVQDTQPDSSFSAVPARRLDDVLRELDCENVDVVKLDIEGAEFAALRGMGRFLEQHGPRSVYCEVEEEWTIRFGYKPADLISYLERLGYKTFVFIRREADPVTYNSSTTDFSQIKMFLFVL